MRKKVLVVTYGGGHVKIASKVIKSLRKRDCSVEVLALTSAGGVLKREGIAYKTMVDYVDVLNMREEVYGLASKYIESAYNIESNIPKDEISAYIGVNLWDLSVQLKSTEKAEQLYMEMGRKAFFPINFMKKILEYEKVDSILLTCGQRSEKAAGIVADKMGIKVVRVIDLLGNDDDIPYQGYVCVMDEKVKVNILKRNPHLNHKQVVVTGQPNLELEKNDQGVKALKEKYNASEDSVIITFFSQIYSKETICVLKKLIELCKWNKNYIVIYKLHPSEKISAYAEFESEFPINFHMEQELNLSDVIFSSDITMTFNSTTGLQSVLNGVPLISINISGKPYSTDYYKAGYGYFVDDLSQLDSTINAILQKKENKTYDLSNSHIPHNAADAIAEILLN